MDECIDQLVQVIDCLLGPEGCPWDKEQTVETLTPMLFEEASEVFDALREKDQDHLLDELGDLIVTFLILCKAAHNEGRFAWAEPFKKGAEKLVRRHPHIFEKKEQLTPEETIRRWDELKKQETFHTTRKNCVDGIPESLPVVARLQKLCSRLRKSSEGLYHEALSLLDSPCESRAEEEGKRIAKLIFIAHSEGLDIEAALRGVYAKLYQIGLGKG